MSSSKANVVNLAEIREQKNSLSFEVERYHAWIITLEKTELLEEMIRFQEERSRIGHLTPLLMRKGRHLFQALETHAETRELRLLARSYRRHLDAELASLQA